MSQITHNLTNPGQPPVAGDWCRWSNGVEKPYWPAVTDTRPIVVVTTITNLGTSQTIAQQAPDNLISLQQGDSTRWNVALQDAAGAVLDITQNFVLPLAGLLGSQPRIINIAFANGLAEFDLTWPTAGLWECAEAQINMDLLPAEQLRFAGCRIKVCE